MRVLTSEKIYSNQTLKKLIGKTDVKNQIIVDNVIKNYYVSNINFHLPSNVIESSFFVYCRKQRSELLP